MLKVTAKERGFGGTCLELAWIYRDADKSLARPTSQCILFDGENTSFDVSFDTRI